MCGLDYFCYLIHGKVLYQGLLAHGFSELLAMAGGEGTAEPWPRIHAFNALRVAFGDSCLTNVASAYFSRGAYVMAAHCHLIACVASRQQSDPAMPTSCGPVVLLLRSC